MMTRYHTLSILLGSAVFGNLLHAQGKEEFVLQNGTRIEAIYVKPNGNGGFLASGSSVATTQFTGKDVAQAFLKQPADLIAAREAMAAEQPDKAADLLEKVRPSLEPYQSISNSHWLSATLLEMDALSRQGKAAQAAKLVPATVMTRLPATDASAIRDFQQILNPGTSTVESQINAAKALANSSMNPWLAARLWLEIGYLHAEDGQVSQAVKAWLRVPVFYPAERDLAVRGTILAARGLQQMDRREDGLKLLQDALGGMSRSGYQEILEIEAKKLNPEQQKTPAAPAEADAAPNP